MAQKKRGRGEGSIFKRADGRWSASITIGTGPTGKRIRKQIYGDTKDDVTEKLLSLQIQKRNGALADCGSMTVGELLDRWLETSSRINTSPVTHARYESISRIHIKPVLGMVKLSKLSPLHVQQMLSKMERDNVGNRTRGFVFATIRRALNVGLRWGLVARNVCSAVDPPKQKRSQITTLNDGQVSDLFQVTEGTRWYALFVLAITTGMRQGELFGLKWENVNLQRRMIAVCHSLEELSGKLRLKEPKSKSGRRQITMSNGATMALERHREILEIEGLQEVEIVFPDSVGNFLRKSNFERRVWKPFRTKAEIPETVTFHDLRHTSATILLGAGVHPKIVQERLGHSSITLTMDTYSHVLPTMQEDAATKFDLPPRKIEKKP